MQWKDVKHVLGGRSHGRLAAGKEITAVCLHSRDVRPDSLFLAVQGAQSDGAAYVAEAIKRGAIAIVSDRCLSLPSGVALLEVPDMRVAVATLAAAFYGYPAQSLQMCGITGTNGKTTTASMLRALLEAGGRSTGMIGTIAYEIGERTIAATRTTPDALQLQQLLSEMVRTGCHAAVLEVSSHALVQGRTHGIPFAVAGFTNLTQDHLDYHRSMEAYYEAKALLFRALDADAVAVIDTNGPYGQRLAAERLACQVLTVGLERDADVQGQIRTQNLDGSDIVLQSPWGEQALRVPAPGQFNVQNALLAFTMGCVLGVPPQTALAALAAMPRVRGRLQPVPVQTPFRVFVDYAHTDDALHRILAELHRYTHGRLIVVFGCGGNRDRTKRALMGQAVAEHADVAVITSDNPRNEDPATILEDIRQGFPAGSDVAALVDRRAGIRLALEQAKPGDTVCIAGKGHERYQEIEGRMLPFDDVAVATEELVAMGFQV